MPLGGQGNNQESKVAVTLLGVFRMSQTSHVHPEPYVHVLITNPFSNNKFRVLFFFLCMQGIKYHLLQLREGYVRLEKAVRLS